MDKSRSIIIERTDEEIIIRIPNTERIINYIKHKVASANSKATKEDDDQLADDLNSAWWDKNKETYLK